MKKTWAIPLFASAAALVLLLFLPWLTLRNDVHLYTIPDILEIESWWWGGDFALPFFCLWGAVLAACATAALQALWGVSILRGRPLSGGGRKAAIVCAIAACTFAGLLYGAFALHITTAYPTPGMAILPAALAVTLLAAKAAV